LRLGGAGIVDDGDAGRLESLLHAGLADQEQQRRDGGDVQQQGGQPKPRPPVVWRPWEKAFAR
jgi:hypothetical protein